MDIAEKGPFRALIMQAAIASMEISYIWAVLDMRDNKCLRQGTHKMTIAASLIVGANGAQDLITECRFKAEVELNKLFEDFLVDTMILGGDPSEPVDES